MTYARRLRVVRGGPLPHTGLSWSIRDPTRYARGIQARDPLRVGRMVLCRVGDRTHYALGVTLCSAWDRADSTTA